LMHMLVHSASLRWLELSQCAQEIDVMVFQPPPPSTIRDVTHKRLRGLALDGNVDSKILDLLELPELNFLYLTTLAATSPGQKAIEDLSTFLRPCVDNLQNMLLQVPTLRRITQAP